MYYCGLDLGKKSSNYCVRNADRKIIDEGETRNRIDRLTKCFGQLPPMRIVVEASTKSFWIADQLEALGHEVIVVDPNKTKAIGSGRIKHDKLDARVLSELCAADLLARVTRPKAKERMERMIMVSRDCLVKSRTRLVTSVRSLLDSEGIDIKSCATDAFVDVVSDISEEIPDVMWNAIEPTLTSIHVLTEQISDCDRRIKETMGKNEEVKRLKTIPGVGTLVAACYLMAIQDTSRFKSGREVGAYLGLVPSLYQSGKTYRRGKITKHGNKQARWLMCVAANALLRTKRRSRLKEWGETLVGRLGRKKAIVAIARKLSSVMWAILKNGTEFEPRLVETK